MELRAHQIPERFQAGGFTVVVQLGADLVPDRNCLGEYCHRTQTILIDRSSSWQLREETFLHELLEALNAIWRLGLSHRQITGLATALHQAFTTAEGDLGETEEEKAG